MTGHQCARHSGPSRGSRQLVLLNIVLLLLLPTTWLQSAAVNAQSVPAWAPLAASLNFGRVDHASVTGPDGKLYAIGGIDFIGAMNSVEVYDPSNAAAGWVPLPASLHTARLDFAAVTGSNGKIYAIAGDTDTSTLATVEVYDPSNPTAGWVKLAASLHTARWGIAAVTAPNGKIYVIGGGDANANALASVEVYDPSNPAAGWVVLSTSLHTARWDLSAVTGPDGKIYAIGGYDNNNSVLMNTEVYDPAQPAAGWVMLSASLNTPRGAFAAITGRDARIYVIGGYENNTTLGSVEVYDPSDSGAGWAPFPAALYTERWGATAATGSDGLVYVMGGYNFGTILADVEVYDPGWSVLPNSLQTARAASSAATGPDGRIYAIGGYNGSVLASVEAYNLSSKTWSPVASLNNPREALCAATGPDGRIYAIGGADYNGNISSVAEAYTPASNTWSYVASLNTARYYPAAATGPDGRIYAIGGRDSSLQASSVVEAYDPKSNTWTPVASLNTARFALSAATGPDGRIYAIGGVDNSGNYLSVVEAFDPTSNTWTPVASLNTTRYLLSAATGPDGRIYAIGGVDNIGLSSAVTAYDPASNTWTPVASLNTARYLLSAATGPDGRVYAIGGGDANNTFSSVEALALETLPVTLRWNAAAPGGVTVTLGAPASPQGLLITLSSSNPQVATVPATGFLAMGVAHAFIPITFGSPTGTTVTVSGTYQGRTVSTTFATPAPLPVLHSLAPNPVLAGSGAFSLTLTGTGFVAGATAMWNGSARTTHYVGSTSLKANITSADIVKAGTVKVAVANPAPGSTSNTVTLTIAAPNLTLGSAQASRTTSTLTVTATLTNKGTITAPGVTITAATLGKTATTASLPISLGAIAPKQSGAISLTFPGSAGASGSKATLTVSGTYGSGEPWKASVALTLP